MARICFIVDEMFEDSEFRIPFERLRNAGHQVTVVGLKAGRDVKGKKGKELVRIERSSTDAKAADFDTLVIPGGYSPDHLRTDINTVRLTREMALAGKPVAAVCHGPWMLIEADLLDGRTVTSYPSIRTDLINAGARWVDREVVEDENIITSRRPEDLEAFTATILKHLEQRASQAAPDSETTPASPIH